MSRGDAVSVETPEELPVGRDLVTAEADGDDRVIEAALRPRTLAEVIGQERVREQLSLVLQKMKPVCAGRWRVSRMALESQISHPPRAEEHDSPYRQHS